MYAFSEMMDDVEWLREFCTLFLGMELGMVTHLLGERMIPETYHSLIYFPFIRRRNVCWLSGQDRPADAKWQECKMVGMQYGRSAI